MRKLISAIDVPKEGALMGTRGEEVDADSFDVGEEGSKLGVVVIGETVCFNKVGPAVGGTPPVGYEEGTALEGEVVKGPTVLGLIVGKAVEGAAVGG